MKTKKDFILEAKTIKLIENKAIRKDRAEFLAELNQQANPRFNKELFLRACCVE